MYLEVALRSRVGNYTKSFLEIGMDSVRQVGGKAASLGELSKAGFPVPPGFAIIGQAFIDFRGKQISDEFMNEVMEQFDLLSTEYVSVRSSALAEDGVDASWAGQMETYLNVTRNQVIEKIRECWDSADSERAKVYAEQNSTKSEDLVVGVVVQKMIDSEVAGVMFTRNPVSGDDAELLIEAAYGLGEGVVSGEITPDSYIVNRDTLKLANLSVYKQNQMVARVNGQTIMIDVRPDLAQQQKLDEITILSLAEIGLAIEKHYVSPQDVEWAAVEGELFILQSRPITAKAVNDVPTFDALNVEPIIKGIAASQGIASGRVRIIRGRTDISKVLPGEILVTHTTTPDYVEVFPIIAGIVTEIGGATNHAAVVSREMGVPAVVGTLDALSRVMTGDIVTIDGFHGVVYMGEVRLARVSDESESFKMPEPSGDDIEDMVNAIVAVINNSNELWPLGPMQLMPYIESDQSVDMYHKLKQLIASGMSYEDIALLFERPIFIKNFLLNTGIVGIKSANVNEKRVGLADQIDFVNLMLKLAKILNHDDPKYITTRNLLWDEVESDTFAKETKWDEVTNELSAELGVLSVNLLALNWSLYWNYFAETGHELHGPYEISGFTPKSRMVVKDYYNLSTDEIWEHGKKFPYSEIRLAQVYNTDEMYLSFGIRMSGKASAANNTHFALFIDGERVSSIERIREISAEVKAMANFQTEYVNSLDVMEMVRKGARISYFTRRKFYKYFNENWYPAETVEGTIGVLGRRFVDDFAKPRPLSLEDKKLKFDPRNEKFPENY